MKTLLISIFTLLVMACSQSLVAEEHNHEEQGHKESGVVKLNPEQIKQIGLKIEILKLQAKPDTVRAPGTVAFNAYRLSDVTTLVDSVVHARYVHLGDHVKREQKLVTLISTALAQAEADYLRAEAEHRKGKQEWIRLKALAEQKIISQARLQQAESNHQAAHASLAAARASLASYGLRSRYIDELMKQGDYGQLVIRAPSAGTIVMDDFRTGQHVTAGTRLLQIADEKTVWVEARFPAVQLTSIRVGQSASITPKGNNQHYSGKVINIHPQLDPVTRTAGVRLEIDNSQSVLQPGMFVEAEIMAGSGKKILLLQEQAIQRQGAELIVFVEEEPGHFERREVRIGSASMGLVPLISGVKEGERVVVKGAFALASELAKSGFEVHNH